MKYDDVKNLRKFCPIPWVGVSVDPGGMFRSCCIQRPESLDELDLSKFKINEIRNSDYYKNLRSDLLNGIENQSCKSCWSLEKNGYDSLRNLRIKEFEDIFKSNDYTFNDDGSLSNNDIYYWDVRQTNLCNMKCIMCGPNNSSLWQDELIKHDPSYSSKKVVIDLEDISKDNIEEFMINNLLDNSMIYFAGGEPLISDLHWTVLKNIVNEGKDIYICYNTNLSKLTYKKQNIIDYWKKISRLYVGASIDCIGERAEYVRFGTKWPTIEKNTKIVSDNFPNSLAFNVTTSLLTIYSLDETIGWIRQWNYTDEKNRVLLKNIIAYPEHLTLKVLPIYIKDICWKKIKPTLETLDDKTMKDFFEFELFKDIDKYHLEKLERDFKFNISLTDSRRGVSIKKYCPELAEWYEGIKF